MWRAGAAHGGSVSPFSLSRLHCLREDLACCVQLPCGSMRGVQGRMCQTWPCTRGAGREQRPRGVRGACRQVRCPDTHECLEFMRLLREQGSAWPGRGPRRRGGLGPSGIFSQSKADTACPSPSRGGPYALPARSLRGAWAAAGAVGPAVCSLPPPAPAPHIPASLSRCLWPRPRVSASRGAALPVS